MAKSHCERSLRTYTRIPGQAARPSVIAADKYLYWTWDDNSTRLRRTFSEQDYSSLMLDDPPALPGIIVIDQVAANGMVYLQYRDVGHWVTESSVRAGSDGVATLSLNPFCDTDTWCNGVYEYRLKIGRTTSWFTVRYVSLPRAH